jgi:hypothetical protein
VLDHGASHLDVTENARRPCGARLRSP